MSELKQRHGCLTAVLMFMLVANTCTVLIYLLWRDLVKQSLPGTPLWALMVLGLLCLFNLVCTIALFKWQKWGFWGIVVSSVAALAVNLSIGLGIGQSLFGLTGVVLLYAVLHIGKENKGWPQLE